MKLCAAKIAEAEAWVELNGLHPQRCGATIKDFCKAMGISDETFRRWRNNVVFVEALNRAREKFTETTVKAVENALIKAARGMNFTREKTEAKAEKVVEYDPVTGKRVKEYMGEVKVVKAVRETMFYPPDIKAAIFVLTNMASESWKQKQETTVQAQGVEINMSLPQEAIDGLNHAIATGAKPRVPKDEEES